jgi:hypothetical protein
MKARSYRFPGFILLGVVSVIAQVASAQPTETANESAPKPDVAGAPNALPTTPQFLPEQYDRGTIVAVLGRTLRLTVVSTDPDGQPIRLMATGLPPNATFSETEGVFTFTPTPEQRGSHVVRFIASDGKLQTQRGLTIVVTENRRPQLNPMSQTIAVSALQSIALEGSDADGDVLVYSADNLPNGAVLDPDRGVITFRPTSQQVGTHVIHIKASDGSLTTASELVLNVEREDKSNSSDNWESFFQPGLGYSAYHPRAHGRWGTFHGATLELLLGSWIHHNDNRGPSHGRIYVQVELLNSTKADVPILFTYAAGFSLSLERNPSRRWLLPMFGLDAGGMSHDEMGSHFQVVPFAGLHAYSSPNLFVNLRGGYRLVPDELERLGGWHASATVNVSVW